MIAALTFDFADALRWGPPVVLALTAWSVWGLRRRGLGWGQVSGLAALRLVLLALLVFLLARPVWLAREDPSQARRPVTVLLDRSESMALEEGGTTRYQRALSFLRDQLLPALKSADLPVEAELFAADTAAADGPQLVSSKPDGKRTNLGGAIAPGIEISLDALFGRAAAVRQVALDRPSHVLGKSTMESIQSGTGFGYAAMVDGLCDRIERELGECTVVATGGLAHLIAPISERIEHVEPWLTLHGLRIIHEKNQK